MERICYYLLLHIVFYYRESFKDTTNNIFRKMSFFFSNAPRKNLLSSILLNIRGIVLAQFPSD